MKDKTYFLTCLIGSIILILGSIITIILLIDKQSEQKEDWSEYDSYIFSIIWPPSLCYNKMSGKDECFDRISELNDNFSFIIHGLWPAYKNGSNIESCNNDKDKYVLVNFNETYTKELSELWPGIYASEEEFWSHEYNKHGYCYVQRIGKNPKNKYEYYFEKNVELLNNYRLLMEDILPNTPMGLHNVTKTKFKLFLSKSQLGLNPSTYSLICQRNDSKKTDILTEIRFNYDINFNLLSKNNNLNDSCPDNFQIYFSDDSKQATYEKYDFYVFSVFWAPTVCKEKGEDCYKRIKKKELNILMINGLWPSLTNNRELQWCNIGEDIQIEEIPSDLFNMMKEYWIDGYSENKDFWNYQYNRYGYCYTQRIYENPLSYIFYFQKSLEIYFDYKLKDFMKKIHCGMSPGLNKLNKTYILEKLNKRYGLGTYSLTCNRVSDLQGNDVFLLYEIRLKLDLNFTNTTDGRTLDNCPEEIYAEFIDAEGPQRQAIGFNETYDMYFFTITWLGTTCYMKGELCYEKIKSAPKNKFTIHGLWPNYRNGTIISDWCNGKNDIEIEIKDSELASFMNQYYINGYHTEEYFWGHEYNKHGYCYMQRNGLDVNDYEAYFNLIKEIYFKYDFQNIFIDMYKDRIELGDKQINRDEVESYLESKGLSKDTYLLVCTNITNEFNGEVQPHLYEIRIRFDLDFNLLKNETDASEFDCPQIFYAHFL